MNTIRLFSFIFLSAISFFSFKPFTHDFGVVSVDGGLVSGTVSNDASVHIFKGIPFATPPVGDLRWKAPQPVKAWEGVRQCVSFGPSPMQASPAPFSMWSKEFLIPKEPISEDCLYLNVWTAAASAKEKRAVLVWIYGGGFVSGGSAVPIYDGEAMARKGIIFVSINYRVGLFGFFAHPELTKESDNNASGNYGLMDQLAALRWVQKNISAFGGDPKNITIAGQSAGSMSVNCLVASPLAKGLFQKAIGESGARFSDPYPSLQKAEEEGTTIMHSLGVSSIVELRSLPAETILKKNQGLRSPVVDGYILPDEISNIFATGKENKIDLLTGWNEDEGLLFDRIKNAEDFKKDVEKNYGGHAQNFLQFYPANTDEEAATSQLKLSRDQIFGMQNYSWANKQSADGSKVYVYRFARKVPGTGQYAKYGAFHTGEVPYAYGNLKFVDRPWQQVDHELSEVMLSYWVNFVKTGDPNGKGLPNWPSYNTHDKKIILLNEKPQSEDLPDATALDFLLRKMDAK